MPHHSHPRPRLGHPLPRDSHLRDSEPLHHSLQHHPHHPNINTNPRSHANPYHHHFNRDPRTLTEEPLPRHGALQVKPKTQHRVHYADTVDTISYPEEEDSRRVLAHCPPQPTPQSRERPLIRGLGDRLRREAMLRSQMAVAPSANPSHGPSAPTPYPVSKTVRTLRLPTGRGAEIDVEYGADDNEGPVEHSPGEVVVEQMSSEWWVEGAQMDYSRPQNHRGPNIAAGQPQWVCCPTLLLLCSNDIVTLCIL